MSGVDEVTGHKQSCICGCLVSAMLLVSGSSIAQDRPGERIRLPIEAGTDLVFVPLPLSNGSSHATVTQIVSGQSGFLWLGTTDGLQRFDGYRFRDFRPDSAEPGSLSGLAVESLFSDRSGKLWVTSDLGVDRYDPVTEKFSHYPTNPSVLEGPIHHVNQDHAGMIWLATAHGLTRIDPATGKMVRYLDQAIGTLRSTFEQKDGTFWVTDKESVSIFDRKTGEITQRILLRDPVAARKGRSANVSVLLLEDHAGTLWVASERDGLGKIDRENKRIAFVSLTNGTDTTMEPGVRALKEDRHGVLWIGTSGGGLFKLDRERQRLVRYRNDPEGADSLTGDHVLALYEDEEGTMWVGFDGGGVDRFRLQPSFFRYRRAGQKNPDTDYVSSAYEDSRGNLWLGGNGVVTRIDKKSGQFTPFPLTGTTSGLSNAVIFSITEDDSGDLWFGSWGAGLHRFNPLRRQWKTYRHDNDDPSSLSWDSVFAVHLDRNHRLWVGTEYGLDAFDPKTERFQFYEKRDIGPNRERAIAEDSAGNLWLATLFNGVHRFDPRTGEFAIYRHSGDAGSLSNDAVSVICVDHYGAVWAGTANGLNRFDPKSGKFTAYYDRDGLAGNSINGIQEDSQGDLWITTNNGLSRFKRSANTFETFDRSDGLPGDLTSIWKTPEGEMLVGSYSGLVGFFPERVARTHSVPTVVLTGFQLNDIPAAIGGASPLRQSISLTDSLTLPYSQRIFTLEFAALSYANPLQTRYRYKLDGFEPAWHEVDASQRSARYTSLASGQYAFHVESRSRDGDWNEGGANVRIVILPPWWNTWWFRTAAALTIGFLIWGIYRFRIHQVIGLLNARFAERLEERTRIAGELHDSLLQGFLSASMQLQVAAGAVAADSPAKPQLEHVLQLIAKVINESRNTLWGLRLSGSLPTDLEEAFSRIPDELALPAPVRFSVIVEGRPRPLRPGLRDEAYRIGREAVVNALRHSRASTIEVELEYAANQLRIFVRDDGCGIDPELLRSGREGHWGLSNMRERAERISARYRILSRPAAGTEVELSIPGHVAFDNPVSSGRPGWFFRLRQWWWKWLEKRAVGKGGSTSVR